MRGLELRGDLRLAWAGEETERGLEVGKHEEKADQDRQKPDEKKGTQKKDAGPDKPKGTHGK